MNLILYISTIHLESDPKVIHISTEEVCLCKEANKTWTFQKRIQLSHSGPLKLWPTPIALHKTTLQHLHAPHTLIPLPRAQTNFSCFQTLSLPEPAVAIKDIHPSTQDDYDWSSHQTINLYPSLILLLSSLSLSLSLSLHSRAILLMCRIWWKSESADRFDTVACEYNKAITIWPWRTANSYVHLSIFLTHVTFHLVRAYFALRICFCWLVNRQKNYTASFFSEWLQYAWFVLLYMSLLHSLSCNWTWFSSRNAASSDSSKACKVMMTALERAVNPSCNCTEQTAGLVVPGKRL